MKIFQTLTLFFALLLSTYSQSYAVTALGTETILYKYFGVNVHMDNCCNGNYSNIDRVVKRLQYIGVRRVRDWVQNDYIIKQWLKVYTTTGIRFHIALPQSSPEGQRLGLARADSWMAQYPDLIDGIEGTNEPDTPHPISLGASLEDSAILQSDVYRIGRKNGTLVSQLSVGAGWTAPLYEGNYKNFGKPPADFGNAHVYPNTAVPPSITLKRIGDLAAYSVDGKAVDVTEFGIFKRNKSTSVDAFMHIAPFSSYLLGHTGLFVYALHDDMTDAIGFYDANGYPRYFAQYWNRTTSLLSDPNGKNLPPKDINITFTNQKFYGTGLLGIKNVVMYKSDGSVWIATYDEEKPLTSLGSQTIVLDNIYNSVTVFDGRSGLAVKQYNNVDRIDIKLPNNHLYLVRASDY